MCSHREISLLTKMGIMVWLTVPLPKGSLHDLLEDILSPIGTALSSIVKGSFLDTDMVKMPVAAVLIFGIFAFFIVYGLEMIWKILRLSFSIIGDIWCYFFWPEDFICDRCRNLQEAQAHE